MGAGEACIMITLELKGTLRLLGSLLPGHLGGQEACIRQGCFDPSEQTSQLNVASGLCSTVLREVVTDATSFSTSLSCHPVSALF